jgi:spermidine synthase
MTQFAPAAPQASTRATLAGIAATSAALLMTELALTRIFSVTMFYHFAFLAISIALFGLSASGVFVYVTRNRLARFQTDRLLCIGALLHAATTLVALAFLVDIRVGLTYSPGNLVRMLAIYVLGSIPFLTGGAVISLAFSRLTDRINTLYAADLLGAAAGCLALVPMLNQLGAPGVVISAASLSAGAAVCFAPATWRRRVGDAAILLVVIPVVLQLTDVAPFDVVDTKGHETDRVLFSKWNSFSRVGVYDRAHDDWSLSPKFTGARVPSLIMDIDSSASTPILKGTGNVADAAYLRHELTAIAYHLVERPGGFDALVIGPGGGRDLLSALLFGARHVDGVEINTIIARDVMLDRFREYSGGIYADRRVSIHVEDGRSFVRRSPQRFDVIQASLVDTWAATAAGAYTLTENSLYTVEAFGDYLDHLSENGVLTITRWFFDGLRLVSLAQEACARRGLDAAPHLAIVRHKNVVTFILKRSPFSTAEVQRLQRVADDLGFSMVYAPGITPAAEAGEPLEAQPAGASIADYHDLILAADRERFLAAYRRDVSATTDDRPFFFHTTRLRDQFNVAFGRSMLFGNGLSALLTLFGISAALVLLFILGPLLLRAGRPGRGWSGWLAYFGLLGAGFMLLEVALLQRFVLLLGHPVYSLTVTLFSLLLGTGLGSLISRRVQIERVRRFTVRALVAVALVAMLAAAGVAALVDLAIPWPLAARIAVAGAVLIPFGVLLGVGLPGGMRLLDRVRPEIVAWGWGMNGALSVVGATLAIFIAMNWGFSVTLFIGAFTYLLAALALRTRRIA